MKRKKPLEGRQPAAEAIERPEKAYRNLEFLDSPDARVVRVLCEFLEPSRRFRRQKVGKTIVFFGSSRTLSREAAQRNLAMIQERLEREGEPSGHLLEAHELAKRDLEMSRYYEDAASLAEKLTRWSMGIKESEKRYFICSGGAQGIMEAANQGARRAGGRSVGLNISLPLEQSLNPYQTKELSFEFHYFFVRKFWFIYLARALVCFPGGFGTMDEMFEVLTLRQTRKTKKYIPIVIYGTEYWKQVVDFGAMVKAGTISEEDLKLFRMCDDVDSAFRYLTAELTRHRS